MEPGVVSLYTRQDRLEFWRLPTALGSLSAGSCPSPDLRTARGQDFVLAHAGRDRLVFAVCDGVSQSFFGDLAAHFLGFRLGEFLWRDLGRATRERTAIVKMEEFLNRLIPEASLLVDKTELGPTVTGILRETLQERKSYGSEAVFAAGRVDLTRGRLSVWQLGNVSINGGPISHTGPPPASLPSDTNRWSSARGVRGRIRFEHSPLPERLLVYTDGALPVADGLWRGLATLDEFRSLAILAQEVVEDDLSFFRFDATVG
jgi:hypothetical protein